MTKRNGCFWAFMGILAVGFLAILATGALFYYAHVTATPTVALRPSPTVSASGITITPGTKRTPAVPKATSPAVPSETPAPNQGAGEAPAGWKLVENLMLTEPPQRDRPTLVERLHPQLVPVPRVVPEKRVFREGDSDQFWVLNEDTKKYRRITADLRFVLPHVYVWVERGIKLDDDKLFHSAKRFDEKTYPTDRSFFGSEWRPGVDRDVHVSILHATGLGKGVAGYFSASDEVTTAVNKYSNQREMFYIDPSSMKPNTQFYDGTLAHEFQHMIHWNEDRNETTWLNEGCSELASFVNGFDPGGSDYFFVERPDTQLDNWDEDMDENTYHYGASYLLMEYSYEQFGKDFIRKLVSEPLNGIEGYNAALKDSGFKRSFYDVFGDWVVANLLDIDMPNGDRFLYRNLDIPEPTEAAVKTDDYKHSEDVHQFGTDYYKIDLDKMDDFTVEFSGATTVPLAPFRPISGKFVWWGHNTDDSDATLTKDIDLSNVKSATLDFWTWYDIEEHYDYAYIMVSDDGGKGWKVIAGDHSTNEDPVGNALGPGYTGKSGGGDVPSWVHEKVDLSSFAGKKIKLRFEYVTDDAVTRDGFFVDDISIPEIGWHDNAESNVGWDAKGFSLVPHSLPQRWLVQVIGMSETGDVVVKKVKVVDGKGRLHFDASDMESAHVAVSAITPITKHKSKYSISIYRASKNRVLAGEAGAGGD
jgi:immune inhibitor A